MSAAERKGPKGFQTLAQKRAAAYTVAVKKWEKAKADFLAENPGGRFQTRKPVFNQNYRTKPGGKLLTCVTSLCYLSLTFYLVESLREIRYYQKSTGLIIPRIRVRRLIAEIANSNNSSHTSYRFQASALDAIQEAAEAALTAFFESKSYIIIINMHSNFNKIQIWLQFMQSV